jgi:hypothetical protein
MNKIFKNPLKGFAVLAICLGLAIIYFTGGFGLGIGILMMISSILLYLINYFASKTNHFKIIQIGVSLVYIFTVSYYVLKLQEHTTFIFSKASKGAVGIVFGIQGYPALPPRFYGLKLSQSLIVVLSSRPPRRKICQHGNDTDTLMDLPLKQMT